MKNKDKSKTRGEEIDGVKEKEDGDEEKVKETNPDVLDAAFEAEVPVVGTEEVGEVGEDAEGLAIDDPEDDMIDSGDFRVLNEW